MPMSSAELTNLTNPELLATVEAVLTGKAKISPADGAALHKQLSSRLISSATPAWMRRDPSIRSLKSTLFSNTPCPQ